MTERTARGRDVGRDLGDDGLHEGEHDRIVGPGEATAERAWREQGRPRMPRRRALQLLAELAGDMRLQRRRTAGDAQLAGLVVAADDDGLGPLVSSWCTRSRKSSSS